MPHSNEIRAILMECVNNATVNVLLLLKDVSMQNGSRKPPYSKYLQNYNLDYLYLFWGCNAWHKATAFQRMSRPVICVPPDEEPISYRWPVYDLDVIIFDSDPRDAESIEDFITILFAYGARKVIYVSYLNKSTIFKKDF